MNLHGCTRAAVAGRRLEDRIDLGPGSADKAISGVLRVSDESRPHCLVLGPQQEFQMPFRYPRLAEVDIGESRPYQSQMSRLHPTWVECFFSVNLRFNPKPVSTELRGQERGVSFAIGIAPCSVELYEASLP